MIEKKTIPVSVYVITKNEEENIARLLDNLKSFAEVIIVDSGSTDRTLEIANSYSNTKVSFNQWPGFGEQKAHALALCSFPWVLNLDADETLSDSFIEKLEKFIVQDKFVALKSTRKLLRWGRQPRSFGGVEKLIRLFKKDCGHYESRQVHESISINGEIKESEAAILHHENLSYSQRIEKTVFYAKLKAQDKFNNGDKTNMLVVIIIFPLTFIRIYLFKGHFMDGFGGVLTSVNVAFYNYMKYSNLWDLNKKAQKNN
ncbi:MAG: glycosyltransferase family 2 protein [Gammaproteobacteria bacterium]|nr:glycosyltransferase family 2 protein [Gammaproteobacteria bacterium]